MTRAMQYAQPASCCVGEGLLSERGVGMKEARNEDD